MHWHAHYAKRRRERQVDVTLRGSVVEMHLPTVGRKVRRRHRPERIVYVLCYVFANIVFDTMPDRPLPGCRGFGVG